MPNYRKDWSEEERGAGDREEGEGGRGGWGEGREGGKEDEGEVTKLNVMGLGKTGWGYREKKLFVTE